MTSNDGGTILWPPGDWPPSANSSDNTQTLDFISHAPLPWRLRNEVITREYKRYACEVAELLGDDVPNWYHWASWASGSVGLFVRRYVPGHRRVRRALGVGNRRVFEDMNLFWHYFVREFQEPTAEVTQAEETASLAQGETPSPLGAPDSPGRGPNETGGTAGPAWGGQPAGDLSPSPRSRAWACYYEAARLKQRGDINPHRRRELVLLGNALIAVHEQQTLQLAISVTMRSTVRRFLDLAWLRPMQSHRQWITRTSPDGVRLRVESSAVRITTRFLKAKMPWGHVGLGRPIAQPPGWVPPVMPDGAGASPFEEFEPCWTGCRCWTSYPERMRTINAMLIAGHRQDQWFRDGKAIFPPEWGNYEREAERYCAEFLAAPEQSTRVEVSAPQGWNPPTESHRGTAGDDASDTSSPFETEEAAADFAVAREVYHRNRPWILLAFLCRSIPASFTAGRGATALAPNVVGIDLRRPPNLPRVPVFAGDSGVRAAVTLQFVDQVMGISHQFTDKSDSPITDAINATRRHHRSHRSSTLKAGWSANAQVEGHGVPINVSDMVGTVAMFVTPVYDLFMATFPRRVTDAQWDAWSRTWCRIGVGLGVPANFLRTEIEGEVRLLGIQQMNQVAHYYESAETFRSAAGVYLMHNFIDDLRDILPPMFSGSISRIVDAFGYQAQLRLLLAPQHRGSKQMLRTVSWVGNRRILSTVVFRAISVVSTLPTRAILTATRDAPDKHAKFPQECIGCA